MDRYLEAFDAAEQARIQGDNAKAVLLYEEAASLAEYSSAADPVALHHMWGVALTSLGRLEDARQHLIRAEEHSSSTHNSVTWAAISRDLALLYLADGQPSRAISEIDKSLTYLSTEDPSRIAERGASIGIKARILLVQNRIYTAREYFGTADALLQRSDNRHYELYNLMHFMEALVEHRFFEDNWTEIDFARNQVPRLRALVMNHGGLPHQQRAANIISSVLAERES